MQESFRLGMPKAPSGVTQAMEPTWVRLEIAVNMARSRLGRARLVRTLLEMISALPVA